jgi:hypothetical protein
MLVGYFFLLREKGEMPFLQQASHGRFRPLI